MKKKLISMLMVATMVVSICACGSNADQTGETEVSGSVNSVETSSQPASDSAALEKELYPIVEEEITLKGLIVDHDTSVSEDRIVWQKVEEVTGINIEWEKIDKDAIATYLAGNNWPDFFLTTFSDSIVNDYGVLGGRFVNLLDYMDYMPNFAQALEDYPVAKAAATELNGEMYEFPGIQDGVTTVYAKPFYRTDYAEKAGITEMPATVEEFKDYLLAAKEQTGSAQWIPLINSERSNWSSIIYPAFGTSDFLRFDADANGEVFFCRTTDQMRHYYEYMHELYEEGIIHPEFASMPPATVSEMELAGGITVIEQKATALSEEYFESGEIELAALKPLTSEYDSTQTYMGRSPVEFKSGPFLNADSEYIEEMCRMFDIMYATEEVVEGTGLYGMSFTYGLEDVHWRFTDDGSYEYIIPENYSAANVYQYAELIWNNAGRNDAFVGMITTTPGNNQVRQMGYAENVIPYEGADYIWEMLKFTEDEQYVIDNKWTDIKSFYEQAQVEFIAGVKELNDENWNAYCAELDRMGIADVLAVYQSAYDRWVSFMQ